MKITVKRRYVTGEGVERDVADFVSTGLGLLDCDNYGQFEQLEESLKRQETAIAKLCDILAGRGLLTAEDIKVIADDYRVSEVKFLGETE